MVWIKRMAVLALILCSASEVNAQTFGEWFRQKRTQKRYLLEQVVALKAYAEFAHKGYGIASKGLATVRDITNGEFSLHELFITGLKRASPVIRNDVRIAEILLLNQGMLKSFNGLLAVEGLSASQYDYLSAVRSIIHTEILDDLEVLALVIVSGKVEMGDDQRLLRLNEIYTRTLERSAFVQDFSSGTGIWFRQQKNEASSLKFLRRLYEQR